LAHSAAAAAAAAGQKGSTTGAVAAAGVSTPLQAPFVSAAGVLALLDACLEVTGSMKGSVSEMLLGMYMSRSLHCGGVIPAALEPPCLALREVVRQLPQLPGRSSSSFMITRQLECPQVT
jgi:hypothetical protein